MTAFRHLRRRPMPIVRHRFRIEGAPSRFVTEIGPAFAGGTYREELRNVVAHFDEPAASRTSSKPHSR
jgi:hypothetical protein